MKRWILLLGLGLASLANTGCFLNTWDPDPAVRTLQLLKMSEDLRQTRQDMARVSLLDQPTALTPIRMNGVVGP